MITELEHRVQLAGEAVEKARQAGNEASVRLHSYRKSKAEQELTTARIAAGEC